MRCSGRIAVLMTIAVGALGLGSTGCAALLSKEHAESSRFGSFESARDAFLQIEPDRTTSDQVRELRFDPAERGVEILPFTVLGRYFLPHQGMSLEMLPDGMRTCFDAGSRCQAWVVKQGRRKRDRISGFWADLLGFHRDRHITGWEFRGAVVFVDDTAVYTLWGGDPRVDRIEVERKPLGPFQSGPKLKVELISSKPGVLQVGGEGVQQ